MLRGNNPNNALDDLLLEEDGSLRILSARALRMIPRAALVAWCETKGLFQMPTRELVDYLKSLIGGRSAIEICSGRGCLGKALGIPSTDSFSQAGFDSRGRIEDKLATRMLLKRSTKAPLYFVERLSAVAAIQKYNPEIVLGAFVPSRSDGGPDEFNILKRAAYIHIGNPSLSEGKEIEQIRHRVVKLLDQNGNNNLISVAPRQDAGIIQIWSRLSEIEERNSQANQTLRSA